MLHHMLTKSNGTMTNEIVYRTHVLYHDIFPKQLLYEIETCIFEDVVVNIPKEYDKVLTILYGDWRTLPPKSKRKSEHNIIKLSL